MAEPPRLNPQRAHYLAIHDAYAAHYYDSSAMWYRDREIFRPLLKDLDFNGRRVADLACGSGYNSLEIKKKYPQSIVEGFDISPRACDDYRRVTGAAATELDLTEPFDGAERFDFAMVIGGLHHCIAGLDQALANVARMVKPGGFFLLFEPNRRFLLNGAREIWYRHSHLFEASSERALCHDQVLAMTGGRFTCLRVRYLGGPAFFFILNSLVTKVPLGAKPFLAPPFMALEAAYNLMPWRWAHAAFAALWQRSDRC